MTYLDNSPSINEFQLKLWSWISEYYMCSEGEVMKAALPSEISLNSFKPKQETCIKLVRNFTDDELNKFLDSLKKAPRQQELLITYLSLSGYVSGKTETIVRKSVLLSESHAAPNTLDTLILKGILLSYSQPVSRIAASRINTKPVKKLSEAQLVAYESIKKQLNEKDIVLLHGVTSSGKTENLHPSYRGAAKEGQTGIIYAVRDCSYNTDYRKAKVSFWGSDRSISFKAE